MYWKPSNVGTTVKLQVLIVLLIRKSISCQNVTVNKHQKSPSQVMPGCASKWDVLELATLRYVLINLAKISGL